MECSEYAFSALKRDGSIVTWGDKFRGGSLGIVVGNYGIRYVALVLYNTYTHAYINMWSGAPLVTTFLCVNHFAASIASNRESNIAAKH